MKLTVGLGSVDEYIRFSEAGADEFFCGYVPYSWTQKYDTMMPLNRREVLCSNVQLGAFSELEILASMIRDYQRPVHLTFNSLFYLPEQYPEIAKIMKACMCLGFQSYIIADPALILYLREHNIDCEIHLSGETGEVNSRMVDFFQQFSLKRVIFHRKNSFDDMKAVINAEKSHGGLRSRTEFEAFILNEMCQFTGAFCNSLHCDELGHLCRIPYWLKPLKESCTGSSFRQLRPSVPAASSQTDVPNDSDLPEGYLCGATGCGLCALYRLRETGITHLKLVGRGNYTDFMEQDIRMLRQALAILETSTSEKDFQQNMREQLFPQGCSSHCYYL
ncbi:U32 family peptidase [Clostridiaceae bacterium Marseille-Q4145]|nr:U32 family peptidase [Clostridiaceae bacterium Marseille-Q4145]